MEVWHKVIVSRSGTERDSFKELIFQAEPGDNIKIAERAKAIALAEAGYPSAFIWSISQTSPPTNEQKRTAIVSDTHLSPPRITQNDNLLDRVRRLENLVEQLTGHMLREKATTPPPTPPLPTIATEPSIPPEPTEIVESAQPTRSRSTRSNRHPDR